MTATTRLQPSRKEKNQVASKLHCTHCGEPCPTEDIVFEDKNFCCDGCKTVYTILNTNGLCQYYDLDNQPGLSLRGRRKEEYEGLDNPEVKSRFVQFSDGERTRLTFFLPQIHCASCIWLLENLYKLNEGVITSRVNFLKKELYLTYLDKQTSLRELAELLASLGYAPAINLGNLETNTKKTYNKGLVYKIGVAGFAFGNIMLLSFPEYLGLNALKENEFAKYLGFLNIGLALPVIFYSAQDYFTSAWKSLRRGQLNIDVPLALGAAVLFLRSVFEILSHTGPGYLDSLGGLIFFLLIGKWFQQRTYDHISFERDYKSYFPITARKKTATGEESVALDQVHTGDQILVRHGELIPADAVILGGDAEVDYSFVTGEAQTITIPVGEAVFAGGRQMGGSLELLLTKDVAQSYLTQLWNESIFQKAQDSPASILANKISRYFTISLLSISFLTLAYWWPRDVHTAINAFTAVLIVACPCAGALAVPFTLGNAMGILGRWGFFLKNTNAIEGLYRINTVVVDKTGTITAKENSVATYFGEGLSEAEKQALLLLTQQSAHPMSQLISQTLQCELGDAKNEKTALSNFREYLGKGIEAQVDEWFLQLGSAKFVGAADDAPQGVYLSINEHIKGHYVATNYLRDQAAEVIDYFQHLGDVYLLSGDNDQEAEFLAPMFQSRQNLHFRQSPKDKLQFIKTLQEQGRQVLMIGDGLNDAGALRQSDVGIVVTEDTSNFTPASDGILAANRFGFLPSLVQYARNSVRLVFGAYCLALVYNLVGLSFAVQGALSPVVAAILMPLSSITIVIYGTLASNGLAKKLLK